MHLLTLVSFAFFTGLVGIITYLLTRKDDHGSSAGYFLAGRTLTGGFIAGSLMLTNLSTEQLVGLNGSAFTDGICVMAWEVIAAMSLVVMALFFLPRYLKSGIATVPQFLAERFDDTTRMITSIIFIIAYAGILLPIILYTGATGLSGILNMSELTGIESETGVLWLTVWLIGILGSLYAIFGGLRTVAVSDTLNGFGLLVGGVMIAVFGLWAVNEKSTDGLPREVAAEQTEAAGDGQTAAAAQPEQAEAQAARANAGILAALKTLRREHPEKFNSIGGRDQSVPFGTLFTGVLLLNLFYWTTNQQIIQRTFGASNLAEGQKGVLYAGILKVMAPMILVLPGIIAFHLYADQIEKPDHAYGMLVRDVLPPPLVGFFAAVMVGAILSSFNSALNSTATLFSLGVYKHVINPKADEEKVIRSGKVFGWAIALMSMTVAPLLAGQDSIFSYLQKMNGLYFIPIFAVVLVGMLTKRVPAAAAKIALVFGFVVIALGYFVPVFSPAVDAINNFHFLGIVFATLLLMMLLLGQTEPMEVAWVHKHSGDVDLTPWKFAKPVGFGLVAFVLAVYAWFADFSILS